MTISEEKKEARKKILSERRALDAQYVSNASLKIAECFLDLAIKTHADTVLLFYPIKNEPELLCITDKLRARGITVGFPISVTKTLTLDFRAVNDLSDMSLGAYGICEPRQSDPIIKANEHTLCAVPALAFDRRGFRLGYGKGYYDRFLSEFAEKSIGLCYSRLLCDALPTDEHDCSVDEVFCEEGGWLCR